MFLKERGQIDTALTPEKRGTGMDERLACSLFSLCIKCEKSGENGKPAADGPG